MIFDIFNQQEIVFQIIKTQDGSTVIDFAYFDKKILEKNQNITDFQQIEDLYKIKNNNNINNQSEQLIYATYSYIYLTNWYKNEILLKISTKQDLIKVIEYIEPQKIAVGGSDLTIKLVSFKNNYLQGENQEQQNKYFYKINKTLTGHKFGINMLKALDNKKFLSDDGPRPFKNRLILWNIKKGQILRVLEHPSRLSQIIKISQNIYCYSFSNCIRFISLSSGQCILKSESDFITQIQKIDSSEIIISGGGSIYTPHEGSLIFMDLKTGKINKSYEKNLEGFIQGIAKITDNHFVTANFQSNTQNYLKLWTTFN